MGYITARFCIILVVALLLFATQSEIESNRAYALSPSPPPSNYPGIVPDGIGGVIIVWHTTGGNILGTRIVSGGNIIWKQPIRVRLYSEPQPDNLQGLFYPQPIIDDSGGAIITWEEHLKGKYNIYAQKIDGNGKRTWDKNGMFIGSAYGGLDYWPNNSIVADGYNGAIIVWESCVEDGITIYAQHLDSAGNILWERGGVKIGSAFSGYSDYTNHYLQSDGFGGAIILWSDDYLLDSEETSYIYAQRIDGPSNILWGNNKVNIGSPEKDGLSYKILQESSGELLIHHQGVPKGACPLYY
ncbi:hypothetical protein ACFLV0_02990 [Chloroflexota bacterium]